MKKLLKTIDKLLTHLSIFLIKLYQYTLSPDKGIFSPVLKGRVCSHEPHCSQYAIQTLKRYGFRNGIGKATDRVLHCKPSMEKIYDPDHYRIAFFSSAPIGVPFLEELAKDKRFEIVGVVTQADKPVGRGLQMQENIIKTAASRVFRHSDDGGEALAEPKEEESLGKRPSFETTDASTSTTMNTRDSSLPLRSALNDDALNTNDIIQTPTKLNPEKSLEGKVFYDRLQKKNPDFLVVIAYGKILPQSILDTAYFGAINVHGSLLPKYRGASPLQSTFLNKEKKSGLTIMKMDAGMDTGDIIDTFSFPIPFHRTVAELIKALEQKGPKFLNDTLRNFAKGLITPMKQNESEATYCQKIEKADGQIDPFKDTLEDIYAKYRAFALRPKIRFTLNGKTIIIEKLTIDETKRTTHCGLPLIGEDVPTAVGTDGVNPAITEILLKPEGKKAMDWKSFANGYLNSR